MRFQTPSRPSTFTTHHLLKQRYSQLTFAAKPQSEQQHLLAALSLSLSLSLSLPATMMMARHTWRSGRQSQSCKQANSLLGYHNHSGADEMVHKTKERRGERATRNLRDADKWPGGWLSQVGSTFYFVVVFILLLLQRLCDDTWRLFLFLLLSLSLMWCCQPSAAAVRSPLKPGTPISCCMLIDRVQFSFAKLVENAEILPDRRRRGENMLLEMLSRLPKKGDQSLPRPPRCLHLLVP
jgi:hypothetical protein